MTFGALGGFLRTPKNPPLVTGLLFNECTGFCASLFAIELFGKLTTPCIDLCAPCETCRRQTVIPCKVYCIRLRVVFVDYSIVGFRIYLYNEYDMFPTFAWLY